LGQVSGLTFLQFRVSIGVFGLFQLGSAEKEGKKLPE
jgi:hypothetical protein